MEMKIALMNVNILHSMFIIVLGIDVQELCVPQEVLNKCRALDRLFKIQILVLFHLTIKEKPEPYVMIILILIIKEVK